MKHKIVIEVETNSNYGVQCVLRRLSGWQVGEHRNVVSYVHTKRGKVVTKKGKA